MKNMAFYFIHWLVTTIALLISWSAGGMVANSIAEMPAVEADPALQASRFLMVSIINAALITSLTIVTHQYKGFYRWLFLVIFAFGIQFFLTQMETFFFAGAIGITGSQLTAILCSGLIVSLLTVSASLGIERTYIKKQAQTRYSFALNFKSLVRPVLLLSLIVYPLLYLLFGHFVAWQDPAVRIFYTGSEELSPFFSQLTTTFITDGIYPYQILRALLWILISLPVISMIGHNKGKLLLFGLANALLPASMLFLPNGFMPADVALTHFYETSSSNFIWGIAMGMLLSRVSSKPSFAR